MIMDRERFARLVAAYGAEPARWPVEERAAARALLRDDPWARERVAGARQLDSWLDSYAVALPAPELEERIVRALPLRPLDRLLRWLLPAHAAEFWRPALAACLPLALGLWLGAALAPVSDSSAWEEEERYLVAVTLAGAEE
jgi:hypothetical protein